MYDNDIYSGSDAGNHTTGIFSGAPNTLNQEAGWTANQSTTQASAQASDQSADQTTNHYTTYQTGSTSAFTGFSEPIHSQQMNSDQTNLGQMYSGKIGSEPNHSEYSNLNQDNMKQKGKEKSGKGGGFFKKALLSISMGLFFGLFAGIGFYAVQQAIGLTAQSGNGNAIVRDNNEVAADFEDESGIKLANTNNITVVESDVSNMVEEVMPAMVSIINNHTEVGSFWGQTYTQEQASSGSGIIVAENDTELLIVSNYHVIADATMLEATFIDGSTAEAKVKGTDADMDLAVIAVALADVSEETKDAISVAKLGDSDDLRLGEPVVAIGNALGYGQSVTNGIVSALNRELTLSDGSTGTFIQTNAAINPGNSGGALLNVNGEVIGINSNKIGGDAIEGMGYAIPITSASPIIADLMERQTRDKVEEGEVGYIGISLQNVTEQHHQMYNMPIGVFVYDVEEGSAAQAAGILPGDIITEFDGENISSNTDLQNILQYYAAGDTAEITIMRLERGQYVEYEYDITLGTRPDSER